MDAAPNFSARSTTSRSRKFSSKHPDQSGPWTGQGREGSCGYHHQPKMGAPHQHKNCSFNNIRMKEQRRGKWEEETDNRQAQEQEIKALRLKLAETEKERDRQTTRADDLQNQLEGKAREDKTLQRSPPKNKTPEREVFNRALDMSGLREEFEAEKENLDDMTSQTDGELLAEAQQLCLELVMKNNSLEEELENEIEKRRMMARELTMENHELLEKVKGLESKGSSSAQQDSLKKELKALKQRNLDMASRLKTAQESNLELQRALDDSRKECGELVIQVNSLEEDFQKSQKLTENCSVENRKLICKMKGFEWEASNSACQMDSLKKELQAAHQSNLNMASRLKTTAESHLELEKALDDSRKECSELVLKVNSLEQETMDKIRLTNEFEGENNSLRLEVEALKDEASNKEDLFGRQMNTLKEELEAQKNSSLRLTSKLTAQEAICKAVQEAGTEEINHQISRADNFQEKLEKVTQLLHESEKVTVWRKAKKLLTPKCRRQYKMQTRLSQLEQQ